MTPNEFSNALLSHQDTLFSFALKLACNYQDAQDLFQNASLRAYRYRDRFEPGTNFRAWMATIIRNTLITQYRKNRLRRTLRQPIETFAFAIESKNTIGNSGEQSLYLQELSHALSSLKALYRIPFLMHYQGYEYKEIAEVLEMPIGTVKSRLNTARAILKNRLQEAA
ncbi:MAG: RNA polymerase sigma factor [Lewinellaceae bacterium]|nr:RNA polymerase sigma factor [Lewinellaceae bacterium]